MVKKKKKKSPARLYFQVWISVKMSDLMQACHVSTGCSASLCQLHYVNLSAKTWQSVQLGDGSQNSACRAEKFRPQFWEACQIWGSDSWLGEDALKMLRLCHDMPVVWQKHACLSLTQLILTTTQVYIFLVDTVRLYLSNYLPNNGCYCIVVKIIVVAVKYLHFQSKQPWTRDLIFSLISKSFPV